MYKRISSLKRFILMANNVENPITQISPFNDKNKAELTSMYDANKPIQLLKIKNGFETQKNNSMNSFLLHQAAIEGLIDQVKLLIKKSYYNIEEIDRINLQGCTPLHLASRFNRLKVVEYLLENGSQINKTTEEENNTPLLLAAKYNMTDIAKFLCEHGADVRIKNIHGSTALHLAASKGNIEICYALIQHGSDINATDSRNCTPLHMAIHGGSETITKLLIENGADVYAKDAEGEGPIHYAAAMDQGELIILLTKGALAIVDEENWEETQRKYVNLRTKKKDAALHIAAREGYLDTVKALVSIGANINICSAALYTPLHLAAINGNKDMVQYLLEHNAKINVFDHQNMTPTHNMFFVCRACQFGRLDVIKLLIEQGAQIDSKDCDSFTPLMSAVSEGHSDAVKYLLKCGASVAISEMNMKNVLHLAIENGHSSTLKVLLQNGGSFLINSHDMDFKRPIHYAAMSDFEEQRKRASKKRANYNEEEQNKKHEQGKLRMRAYRQRQKALKESIEAHEETPYKTKSAEKRAINRVLFQVNSTMPHSPRKCAFVKHNVSQHLLGKSPSNLIVSHRSTALSPEVVELVINFFQENDISRMAPGQRDFLKDGDKLIQKRHLQLTLREAHKRFQQSYKNVKIGKSKFASLCPKHVLLCAETPHNVCVCSIHYNFIHVVNVLAPYFESIPLYDNEWTEVNAVCINPSEKCFFNECTFCQNAASFQHLAVENEEIMVSVSQWQKTTNELLGRKQFVKVTVTQSLISLLESVKILIQESADTEVTDNEEKTPLHIAAEYGKVDCLLKLVKNSTRNINCTDEKGQSPLHLAAKNGWTDTSLVLIEMGAQISGRDDSNWTPLDYAARNGHTKIVIALIKNGACVNEYDPNRLTPLHHASINGHVKCINILLNHGANISFQNADGKNCLDLALENHHTEACRIFITHKRWKEVLNHIDNEGCSPMEKLISYAPEIAQIVLDKCIEYSKLDENSEEYYIRYDFKYLDSHPENSSKRIYFGPSCMITFNQENLLSHPLTVQLINYKWSRLGRWIHLISLFIYVLFVAMLTGLLIIDKEREKKEKNGFQKIIPTVILILSSFEICKEFVQAYLLKKDYFKDFNNYLELILYSSTFIFMLSFIKHVTMNIKWTAGVFSILFAWTNLLLYLKRDTFFGVYVVMIIEVLKSLINVIMVFVMIIIAFSLSFFVLFENSSFSSPEWSMVKTIVMTLGETDFNDLFINNNTTVDNSDLPYPEMSYILFTLFLIVCPIVLMNLLVGLAVGNIADVRDSAYILMLKAQVDILKALESRYPKKLLKKTYHEILTVYPNTVSWKKSFFQLFGIPDFNSLKDKQESRSKWKTNIARDLELEHIEFDHLEKRIETIKMLMRKHLEITDDIIVALKISENLITMSVTNKKNAKHENKHGDKHDDNNIYKNNNKHDNKNIDLHDDTYSNKQSNRNCKKQEEVIPLECISYFEETDEKNEKKDKVLKLDSPDQNDSNYQTMLKLLKSPKISLIRLLHLKPRVEDELDGLISPQSTKTPELIPGCEDELNDKENATIFNIPKCLFDFSNEKCNIFTRSYMSEYDKDSSRFSLHLAAKEGAIERIRHIIEECKRNNSISSKEFVNVRDKLNEKGFSALHLAARYNNVNVVAYLLENGALIDSPDRDDGNTPLLLAAKYKKTNTAVFLIEKGANVLIRNYFGTTALHYASRRGDKKLVIKILKIPFVNINVEDDNLATPLHLAMNDGCKQVVNVLINNGANVLAKNNKGERPIHNAASSNADYTRDYIVSNEISKKIQDFQHVPSSIAEDLIELLLRGALQNVSSEDYRKQKNDYVNSRTNENYTPLHFAARCGNEKSLNKLIRIGGDVNAQTNTGSTPLHLAAISGHEKVVNMLITYKADIQSVDKDLMTPLHRACQFGRLSVVRLLDEKRAILDVNDKKNYTPVMCAIWKGHLEVIKYLIGQGIQINSTDINYKNCIHIALKENQIEVIKFLLDNDQFNKMNSVDKNNRAPVHYAALKGNSQALQLLINKNAPIDIGDNQEKTPLHLASEFGHLHCVKLLISTSPGEVNATDARGMTPLHLAVLNDHRDVIKLLIVSGANVYLRDNLDWSSLDYAAQNGKEKSLNILLSALLKKDYVNASDKNRYTPLHHAATEGHVECINLLLEHGANVQLQTNENKNCLYLAVENLQKEACMAIMQHERWREALLSMDNSGTHVMKKMIELTPEVGEKALDNCIICSKLDIKNPDYSVEYNFEFIDKDPMNPDNSFFAPLLMVKYKRGKLLSHPLVVELINQKWSRMGQWIYLCSLCFYLIFVSFLTALVILERINSKSEFPHQCKNHENHFAVVISWLTLSIACIQIFFKLILAAYIGRSYMFDPVKLLEFFLYTSTALFMVSFVACKYNLEAMKRQSGSVSILLAWSKLMLYLENLPFLGLYFVMFTEVLYTFLKVLLVFSILLIGFGLSFFTLLHNQQPFSGYFRSIVKTFVMMLGELTYGSTFKQENKKAHNEDLSIIIFLLFAIIMVIVVMNLLVGLAVGDIESVRKNAYLRVLQRKVYYLNILDRTYPKFIQMFVYQKSYTKKPNIKSWYEKLMLWMGKFHKKGIEEKQFNAKKQLIMREVLSNKGALLKQKQNTKLILYNLENQIEKTKKIAKSISQNSNVKIFFD
ncbi:uncharacterized protein LOC101237623 isoform X1 [Hydra vulgaris]|uniref:uncharacterized protein LOC101237623 isoform X1 n=1 Tax=Hydra vulgaris TaxID=6087 RepID=UPI0032E9E601